MLCNNPRTRTPLPRLQQIDRSPRLATAFTLMEMMVVLVLIGLLATLVTVNVRGFLIKGKQNAARAEVSTFIQAVETFYSVENRYPTNEEGLVILTQKSARMPEPPLTRLPNDPWDHPYQYNAPGRNSNPYEIVCFGADGREGGGEGTADEDIISWQLEKNR